jgi:hypothetical protein
MRYTPRSEAEVPAALLARIDTCIAVRHESAPLSPGRWALFLARGMRLALDAGEPIRILQGLGGMCFVESMSGTARSERRTDELLVRIDAMAEQLGTPAARAAACVARTLASWMLGRSQEVIAPSYEAERLYRSLAASRFDGSYYMRMAVVSARIGALQELADHRTFVAELDASRQEARATENIAAELYLALNESLLDERCGRSEASIERLERQRAWLPTRGFGTYHVLHMIGGCIAAAAARRYEWGLRLLEQDWPRFEKSRAGRAANIVLYARACRARLLLNHHHGSKGDLSIVRCRIRADIAALTGLRLGRGAQLADVLRARLAYAEGDREQAIGFLRRACDGPTLHEGERARYALGLLIGGDDGQLLCAASRLALQESGLPNPDAYVSASFPELFPSG